MEFKLNETQKIVKETARELSVKLIGERAIEFDEERGVPDDLVKRFGDADIIRISFPKEYDGLGLGYMEQAMAFEEIAKVSSSVAMTLVVHSMFMKGIRYYGNEEQKQKFLVPAMKVETRGSFAFTEPDTGSDPKQVTSTYRKEGDSYVLNGTKRFITNAGYAGPILLYAKNVETDEVSAFVFDKFLPGYSLSTPWDIVGIKGSPAYDVFMDEMVIPGDSMVSKEGKGFDVLIGTITHSKVNMCALFLGTMVASYERSVKYAREKMHRGKPISKFPQIGEKIVKIAMMVETARMMTYKVGEITMDRSNFNKMSAWVAMAKAYVSDLSVECNTLALKVLGPYGVADEYDVERYLRDSLIGPIVEGVSDVQRVITAGYILGGKIDDFFVE